MNQDQRADGIVGVPEVLPEVRVGQMFTPSYPDKSVDHKHAVGPDDDVLCGIRAQLEGDDRCWEFRPGHGLSFSMQNAYSASQRGESATVRQDPSHAVATTAETAKGLVFCDWQLRVPVIRRETTEPKDGTGMRKLFRLLNNLLSFVQSWSQPHGTTAIWSASAALCSQTLGPSWICAVASL